MNTLHRCKPQLGTFIEVSVTGDVSDKALINLSNNVFKHCADVETKMSFHNANSELSHINSNAHLQPITMSEDMTKVMSLALQLSKLTNGLYDVTIAPELVASGLLPNHGLELDPTSNWKDISIVGNQIYFQRPLAIDLGGIAKGYAVDKAMTLAPPDCQVTINAGGDLKMSHWQTQTASLRVPYSPSSETKDIPMQAAALATSGHYFLDGNIAIINPLTKLASNHDISISVFSDSCMLADALTKVAFLCQDSQPIFSSLNASFICLDREGKFSSQLSK